MSDMNYYEVAITKYIGKDTDILTYSSKIKLERGTAVSVYVRNKEIIGIVINEVKKPSFKTKDITKIIFEKPVISNSLLETCFWLSDYYGASLPSVFQTILPSGIATKRRTINKIYKEFDRTENHVLTVDQKKIVDNIIKKFTSKPHLIFGITGSGKTEIYIRLVEKVINEGKQAIILVPEISLTPQAIERYSSRFGDNIAILHSYLKETERFSNWKSVLDGEKNIIIGSRSAIFAPCNNLGLIIIDEAHESSYKQDQTPRYNAIKVAEKIAKLGGAALVFGTATPTIESYFKALNGEYELHNLRKRIIQDVLPTTKIVDMRNEFRRRNRSIFSEKLQEEINLALAKKQQIILFLNRRGMSTFVSCRECGYVEKCPNCDLPLTFHMTTNELRCHHCNHKSSIPTLCPNCNSFAIKYFGGGTQKIELEIRKLVGESYRIARMDTDTTRSVENYTQTYNSFVQGKTDILIGTQIISKGWDIPNIGLVGIISADTLLNFPDIYSPERTFNLLTQVAGRTGRGKDKGTVIIQTYNPENPAIRAASAHDFNEFYQNEIKEREELKYPPFAKLIKLLYNNKSSEIAEAKTIKIAAEIDRKLGLENLNFNLIGPSPAFISKIAGNFRWQILLKIDTNKDEDVIMIVKLLRYITKNEWSIDVDPMSLI
jgi:primosomal protein N' (replication factor Y)